MTAIVWKRAAQALASGGELIVRHPTAQPRVMLWLDWQDTRNLDTEHRLSRLTRWILDAEQSGALWGLRLPGFEAPPDAGESHCRRGLEKLALWTAP
jgi:hypothetical protein